MSAEFMQPGENYGEAIRRCEHFKKLGETAIEVAIETEAKFGSKDLSNMDFDAELAELDIVEAIEQKTELKPDPEPKLTVESELQPPPQPQLESINYAANNTRANSTETARPVADETAPAHQKKPEIPVINVPDKADIGATGHESEASTLDEVNEPAIVALEAPPWIDDRQPDVASAAALSEATRRLPQESDAEGFDVASLDTANEQTSSQKASVSVVVDSGTHSVEFNPLSTPDGLIIQPTNMPVDYESVLTAELLGSADPEYVPMPEAYIAELFELRLDENDMAGEEIHESEITAIQTDELPEPDVAIVEPMLHEALSNDMQHEGPLAQEIAKPPAETYEDFLAAAMLYEQTNVQPEDTSETVNEGTPEDAPQPVLTVLIERMQAMSHEVKQQVVETVQDVVVAMQEVELLKAQPDSTPEMIEAAHEQMLIVCEKLFKELGVEIDEANLEKFIVLLGHPEFIASLSTPEQAQEYVDKSMHEEDDDTDNSTGIWDLIARIDHGRFLGPLAVGSSLAA